MTIQAPSYEPNPIKQESKPTTKPAAAPIAPSASVKSSQVVLSLIDNGAAKPSLETKPPLKTVEKDPSALTPRQKVCKWTEEDVMKWSDFFLAMHSYGRVRGIGVDAETIEAFRGMNGNELQV
jgi:hypothetical protein